MKNVSIFSTFLAKNAIYVRRLKTGIPCFKDGQGKGISTKTVYRKYMDAQPLLDGWEYMSESEMDKYMQDNAPEENSKEEKKRTPPTQFINEWIDKHSEEWDISPMGKRITLHRRDIPIDKDPTDLEATMMMDVYDSELPYREGEISRGIKVYLMNRYHNGVANMFEGIRYNDKANAGLEKWLNNVYAWLKPEESPEIFSMMMKQWGWQTKRKILGRPVKWHIWNNLYGASGLGKTTAIKKICRPMEDVTSTTTMAKLFDDTREVKRLTENYVLIFDELAINSEREEGEKLSGDQLSTVKSLVTGDTLDTRVFNTQEQSKKRITFSCISSANSHLYDIVYDPETMRRFFEFHCQAKATGDFSMIESTLEHSEYFWRGIDENNDQGYFDPDSALGKEVQDIQKHYYPTKSSVFDFMNEVKMGKGNTPAWRAYKPYKQYCINCGRKPKAMPTFISDIKHAIPESVRGDTAFIGYTLTELCKDHKYDDFADDLPSPNGSVPSPVSLEPFDFMKENM